MGSSACRLCHYPGVDIKEEWEKFKSDNEVKDFYLIGNPDDIWKEFRKLFVLIRAAGGLVKNSKKEYLLIFRNRMWDLPKGKMDEGEETEETALREVEEECGIKKLKIVKPIGNSYHIYELKGKLALKLTYWFEMSCGDDKEPTPQLEEGIEKAIWVKAPMFKQWRRDMYPSVWDILKDVE